MDTRPTHCHFEHTGFAALGVAVFRLTTDDRVAALAMNLDNSDVIVPLRAVAQLFGIQLDSADGRMLNLVEQSLRFVTQLKLGEKLPAEVSTGEASWQASKHHHQSASAKLQLELLRWIGGAADSEGNRISTQMLIASIDDPAIRPRVQEALRRAAGELGVEGGGPAVAALIEELANELSYFEALRERLLERVRTMTKRLVRIGQETTALATTRRETLFQVIRLATSALIQLVGRFEEVDAQSSEIIAALRNLERQRTYLRPQRDRLYSLLREWEPLLDGWDGVSQNGQREPESVWRMVDESYRFLASRYMAVQEWQTPNAAPDKGTRSKTTLVW